MKEEEYKMVVCRIRNIKSSASVYRFKRMMQYVGLILGVIWLMLSIDVKEKSVLNYGYLIQGLMWLCISIMSNIQFKRYRENCVFKEFIKRHQRSVADWKNPEAEDFGVSR